MRFRSLNAGRLPVLREWVRYARARRFRGPIVSLAEIELELRRGRHLTALTLARAALSDEQTTGALRYRIAMTAARAAHAGSRDEEALDLYRDALGFALTEAHERDARWGELVCTAALERPEAHSLLEGLRRSVDASDPRDLVRLADRQLSVGFRFGFVRHLADSRAAAELVDRIDDPFVRCSFRTVHGWALALSAYFDEALVTARALIEDATEHRVDPAMPYALATETVALRTPSAPQSYANHRYHEGAFSLRKRNELRSSELINAVEALADAGGRRRRSRRAAIDPNGC